MGNHSPNPESDLGRVIVVRGLAEAVVVAVERGDIRGARAAAKALVAYVGALANDVAGNDNGVRVGLAFEVSPASALAGLALRLAA